MRDIESRRLAQTTATGKLWIKKHSMAQQGRPNNSAKEKVTEMA